MNKQAALVAGWMLWALLLFVLTVWTAAEVSALRSQLEQIHHLILGGP